MAAGCAHGGRAAAPAENLAGLELPLRMGGVRASVEGTLHDEPVVILLDVAEPRTRVSETCFGDDPPRSDTSVRIRLPSGEFEVAKEISLSGVALGGRSVGTVRAALSEASECQVVLGSDVLAPYALQVDPASRLLRLLPSQPRESYAAALRSREGEDATESHLLDLVRDPSTDWPLLAIRLGQDGHQLTGPFVLSTSRSESLVSAPAAKDAELQPGPSFLRDFGVPAGMELPENLGGNALSLDRFELSPGFGLGHVTVALEKEWKGEAVIGVLGGDVWGRFVATIDPAAGVLLLERPRVTAAGRRQRCARSDGEPSEVACFELRARDLEQGVEVKVAVWRDLPTGGRIYLEPLDANGQPVGGLCRVGFTFGPSDRGVTAAHRLPWNALEENVPECAWELQQASSIRFLLMDEDPLDECPGNCAFAHGLASRRVSCECTGSGLGATGQAEQRFMERYRDLLQKHPRPTRPIEPDEPRDPE